MRPDAWISAEAAKKPAERATVRESAAVPTLTMSEATRLLRENNIPFGGQPGSKLKNWEQISSYVGANLLTSGGTLRGTASPLTEVNRTVKDDKVVAEVVGPAVPQGSGGRAAQSTTYDMVDERRLSGMDMDRYRNFYQSQRGRRPGPAAALLSPFTGYGGPRSTAIGNSNVSTATKTLLGV